MMRAIFEFTNKSIRSKCIGINGKIGRADYGEFHAPLQKQIITLQKFNIPISIDSSIKTHEFVTLYALGRPK